MIGIQQIASYIPGSWESNYDKKKYFDIDDSFIEKKIGVLKVSRKLTDEETSDMCISAFRALQKKLAITPDEIDCLIVCTQNPDGSGLPHTSAIIHGKMGCKHDCAVFDISLGCSGYVYSLSIAQSFMTAHGFKTGLLFTADPYSKIIDPCDKNTVLLFGDAATVTLLSDKPVWYAKQFSFYTIGKDYAALQCVGNRLSMNGRAVFNFSATVVPQEIKDILKTTGIQPEQIDLFVFHQGSKYIIDVLQQRLLIDAEKVPSNLKYQGNTVSSSIPMLLEKYISKDINRILACGFGVGLSCAVTILEKY